MAYQIATGDTLTGIASRNGVSVASILSANPTIKDANKIQAGASLTIPTTVPKVGATTIQTSAPQRATDLSTQNAYSTILNSRAGIPSSQTIQPTQPTGNPNDMSKTATQPVQTPTQPAQTGTQPNQTYTKNTDGTFTPIEIPPADPIPKVDTTTEDANISEIKRQIQDVDSQHQTVQAQMEQLKANDTAENQQAIATIQANFTANATALKEKFDSLSASRTQAGYADGGYRYTPQQQEGLVSSIELAHIQELGKLQALEQTALLEASKNKRNQDWDALAKNISEYNTTQDNKTALLAKLLTATTARNKKITDENKLQELAKQSNTGSKAIATAKGIAPALYEHIQGLSDADAQGYVVGVAKQYGIDSNVLISAIQNQGDTRLKLSDAHAKTVKTLSKTTGTKGGGTKAPVYSDDVNTAVTKFADRVKSKGFAGIDPTENEQVVKYLQTTYGYKAVSAYKTALKANNLTVDVVGDNKGAN